jgi:phosphatidylglycerophosphatase A
MDNKDQTSEQYKWLTKRLLKFIGFGSLLVGSGCLVLCIRSYIKDTFLKAGATIDPNPKVIDGMIGMIKAGFWGIIPALSVILLINSFLMLMSSKKLNSKK